MAAAFKQARPDKAPLIQLDAHRTLEMLSFHTGLGALIAALGGYALPRLVAAQEVVASRPRPGAAGAQTPLASERRAVPDGTLAGGYVGDAPGANGGREEHAADLTARPVGDDAADAPAARREAEPAEAPAAR